MWQQPMWVPASQAADCPYETFRVSPKARRPLIDYMVGALEQAGCRILLVSEPDRAPFRMSFEDPDGNPMGILAYVFLANSKPTRNRPLDEHRFQVKYGPNDKRQHAIWQDPYGIYTTLFLGLNPEADLWVAADPRMHDPTRFYISIEFKQAEVERILEEGWHAWEREKRSRGLNSAPVEVLVGGRQENFLDLIRFERLALGLDPGHRHLLADKIHDEKICAARARSEASTHPLEHELALPQEKILDLIQSAPRLKMAVRGWVAETHLVHHLEALPGVERCEPLEVEGSADVSLFYRGRGPYLIECKNVLRRRLADGTVRLDFQRTRASKADSCSRYYSPSDFHLVAACLHSCTESWDFSFAPTTELDPHPRCAGKLSNLVRIDQRWRESALEALEMLG